MWQAVGSPRRRASGRLWETVWVTLTDMDRPILIVHSLAGDPGLHKTEHRSRAQACKLSTLFLTVDVM